MALCNHEKNVFHLKLNIGKKCLYKNGLVKKSLYCLVMFPSVVYSSHYLWHFTFIASLLKEILATKCEQYQMFYIKIFYVSFNMDTMMQNVYETLKSNNNLFLKPSLIFLLSWYELKIQENSELLRLSMEEICK